MSMPPDDADAPQDTPVPPTEDTPASIPSTSAGVGVRLPPTSVARTVASVLGLGAAGAFTALLFALRPAASATLPYIVTPDPVITYQEVVDVLPIPRLLDWDLGRIESMIALRDMNAPTLWGLGLLLLGALWLAALGVLNPTFRIFRHGQSPAPPRPRPAETPGADDPAPASKPTPPTSGAPASSGVLNAALDETALAKALKLVAVAGPLLAVLWLVAGTLTAGGVWSVGWLLRCIVAGAVLFAMFRPDGFAGDFRRAGWSQPRRALPGLLARGALWGVLVWLMLRVADPRLDPALLDRYRLLGAFGRNAWAETAGRFLFVCAALGFGAAGLLAALGRPSVARPLRTTLLVVPTLALVFAVWTRAPMRLAAVNARFDFPRISNAEVRDVLQRSRRGGRSFYLEGRRGSAELAQKTGLPASPPPVKPRTLLIFPERGGVYTARVNAATPEFLPVTLEARQKVGAYLSARAYRSALSAAAVDYLTHAAWLQFEPGAAARILVKDLALSPHNAGDSFALREMLFTCAATKENHAVLDQWADEEKFGHLNRVGRRFVGDLYLRFGDKEAALRWYGKAEMPRTFLRRIRREKPLFNTGRAQGRLVWNGRPLVGATVAALPVRMNGVPSDVANEIRVAGLRLRGYMSPDIEGLPPYSVMPRDLRWVSACVETDTQGRFAFDRLTEGAYLLLILLPADLQPAVPEDPSLSETGVPRPFILNYFAPEANLGTIELRMKQGR